MWACRCDGRRRCLGYGWSFATITPAIFETSDLVQALLPAFARRALEDFARDGKSSDYLRRGVLDCAAGGPAAYRRAAFCAGVGRVSAAARPDQPAARFAFVSRRSFGRVPAAALRVCAGGVDLRVAVGILELLGGGEVALHISDVSAVEDFEMPAPGFLGFLPFALECFVMYVTAAWLVGWVKRVK